MIKTKVNRYIETLKQRLDAINQLRSERATIGMSRAFKDVYSLLPVLLHHLAAEQRMAILRHGEELLHKLAIALQQRGIPCYIYDGISLEISPMISFCQARIQQEEDECASAC